MIKKLLIGLAAFGAVSLPVAVAAQTPTAEQAAETPIPAEKLRLAEQIVDESFPVGAREQMFRQVSEQLNAQLMQSLATQIDDEGAMKVLQDWQKELAVEQNAVTARNIPMLMDAFARSYATIFNETELRDILAFVSTDSGRAYVRKSIDVMSEPNFAAANQVVMDELMAMIPAQIEVLQERFAVYSEAKTAASE